MQKPDDSNQEEIKPCFGFVAILDALGVSSYDMNAAKVFLENRLWILNNLESLGEKFGEFEDSILSPQIYTFGDTVTLPELGPCSFRVFLV